MLPVCVELPFQSKTKGTLTVTERRKYLIVISVLQIIKTSDVIVCIIEIGEGWTHREMTLNLGHECFLKEPVM
jgi:hypothetical protein